MKFRIPGRLPRKNDPSPSQEFAGSGNNGQLAGLAATDQALIKDVQGIVTIDSTDITYLRGPHKWEHYPLYTVLDIYSRYVVGWMIAESRLVVSWI